MDPNEISEIGNANSRQNVRKLIKDGFAIKKPAAVHSRSRVREATEARRKGRHTGHGKRKGTKDARYYFYLTPKDIMRGQSHSACLLHRSGQSAQGLADKLANPNSRFDLIILKTSPRIRTFNSEMDP